MHELWLAWVVMLKKDELEIPFKAKYIWDNFCMFLKNESVKLLLV